MILRTRHITRLMACLVLLLAGFLSATARAPFAPDDTPASSPALRTGAERTEAYLPLLEGQRVALVVNQTAQVAGVALPDSLLRRGIDVRCIMAPEHGYRGTAEAGAHVANGRDSQSGLEVLSLYGKDKKPRPEWLDKVDVVVFDIQDVGCRFYTYLSTLYYVMQACAEQDKPLVVLDRPNPNDTIDGPMLDVTRQGFRSFVGIVPVPLMHGCTLGEMAQMINGEGWLDEEQLLAKTTRRPSDPASASVRKTTRLTVIPCQGWKHGQPYHLPVAPSLNLRNDHAIALYPSLCLFEGSEVSVGRGTDHPFEMFGSHDLRQTPAPRGFSLRFYLQHQQEKGWGWITRRDFFCKLSGTDSLYLQLSRGMTEAAIRQTWQADLEGYRQMRSQYVLYE